MQNFKVQLNKFNDHKLNGQPITDVELKRILTLIEGKSIYDSAKILRDKLLIEREDGTQLYVELINTKDWCKNLFQVTTQTTIKGSYGDLLYALYGATSGEVAISQISGAINQAILCIKTNENKFFLKYWLENMKVNILNVYLQGGQGNLSASIIKSLKINLPHIDEQAIIAKFFVAFDKKIQREELKLNSLIQQKQAFMQQMFI